MSECDHDKRFRGVFDMPKETNGCVACGFEQATAEVNNLRAQVAELERDHLDAERWQHLMLSFGGEHDEFLIFKNGADGDFYPISGDELRTEVDAAMGSTPEQGAGQGAERGS